MTRTDRLVQGAQIVVGVVVGLAALDHLESVAAPIALALVAGVVLSPVSDFWERKGAPPAVGALTSLLATVLLILLLAAALQPAVAQLVAQVPTVWADLGATIDQLRDLARGLQDMQDRMSEVMEGEEPATGASPGDRAEGATPSDPPFQLPTLGDAVLLAPAVLAQFLVFIGALFFFLLTRAEIYDWAARRLSEPTERAQTARRLRDAERRVARYFLTISAINAVLGIATAAVLQALGMPGALFWGLAAFLMNFILYLGPAIVAGALLLAGIGAFDGVASILPALAFVTLNSLEGQFATPTLVGRSIRVNPLLVFLSLVLGIFLWGPIGGVVAIPLLIWVLVLNDGLAT